MVRREVGWHVRLGNVRQAAKLAQSECDLLLSRDCESRVSTAPRSFKTTKLGDWSSQHNLAARAYA